MYPISDIVIFCEWVDIKLIPCLPRGYFSGRRLRPNHFFFLCAQNPGHVVIDAVECAISLLNSWRRTCDCSRGSLFSPFIEEEGRARRGPGGEAVFGVCTMEALCTYIMVRKLLRTMFLIQVQCPQSLGSFGR